MQSARANLNFARLCHEAVNVNVAPKMANFSFGGKNIPKHELMQSLLSHYPARRRIKQETRSTQTSPRRFSSDITLETRVETRKQTQGYQSNEYINLMACLKERVIQKEEEETCCCCCTSEDDDWSNNSSSTCDVLFPKETRQAVSMLMDGKKSRGNSKFSKTAPAPPPIKCETSGLWPGVAARLSGGRVAIRPKIRQEMWNSGRESF